MKHFLGFVAVLGSLLVFACSSKDSIAGPSESGLSSSVVLSSSEVYVSSSSEVLALSSSSEEASSPSSDSSSDISSSSEEENLSSSSLDISSSSDKENVSSSSSVKSSSSSLAKSSSSAAVANSSSSVKSSSSSNVAKSSSSAVAIDPRENFHIYLAFGQSNMEGIPPSGFGTDVDVKYKRDVDPRFQVMTAVAGKYKLASGTEDRKQGEWYTAVPPIIRYNTGLSPADYFGRTIVANTPSNIKVGIIVVAVSGSKIEGFEKGPTAAAYFKTEMSFLQDIAKNYDNNPYNRLITLAKEAQKVGVIKGIIMHQGEFGSADGDARWAPKVKGIYDNMLSDLGLPANSIPFLAGEPVITDANPNQNKADVIRGLTKTMTAKLPSGEPVAYVISSKGCKAQSDNLHFNYEGYQELGTRYGKKMLELLYK